MLFGRQFLNVFLNVLDVRWTSKQRCVDPFGTAVWLMDTYTDVFEDVTAISLTHNFCGIVIKQTGSDEDERG